MLFYQHKRGGVVVVEKTYLPLSLGGFIAPTCGREREGVYFVTGAETHEVADVPDFHCSIRFCLGL